MKNEWCRMMLKSLQGMVIAFVLFFLCIGFFTLLMLHTSMPETWMPHCVLAAASLACFWAGLQQGSVIGRRGLVFGILAAAVVMLGLTILCMMISTGGFIVTSLQPIKLFVLLFGGIGGIIGANVKKIRMK